MNIDRSIVLLTHTGRDELTRPAKCTQNHRLKSGEMSIKICGKKKESRDDNFLAKWLTEQVRVMEVGLEPHNLAILSRSVTWKGGSESELKELKSCIGSKWILTVVVTHSSLFCFVFGLTWNNHLRQLIILTRPKWKFVVQPAASAAYGIQVECHWIEFLKISPNIYIYEICFKGGW